MQFMTLEQFKSKWGVSGDYPGSSGMRQWRIDDDGDICLDDDRYITTHECQYSGWDAYLTAIAIQALNGRYNCYSNARTINEDRHTTQR